MFPMLNWLTPAKSGLPFWVVCAHKKKYFLKSLKLQQIGLVSVNWSLCISSVGITGKLLICDDYDSKFGGYSKHGCCQWSR